MNLLARAILNDRERSVARRRYQQPSILRTAGARPQWFFRARVDVPGGRREQKFYLGYCVDVAKKEAEKARDKALETINATITTIPAQMKFSELVAIYRKTHLPTLAMASQKDYDSTIDCHLMPRFGEMRLYDITRRVVQDWANSLNGFSWNTRVLARNVLSSIFHRAEDWEIWQGPIPTKRVSVGRKEFVRRRDALTPEQYEGILKELTGALRLMFTLAVWTGMRISEILGLQWRHIDLEGGTVRVEQRMDRWWGLGPPKSAAGVRTLPLRRLTAEMATARPAGAPGEAFVFPEAPGYSTLQLELRRAAKAAGVEFPGFGWHTLRRTHLTWLDEQLSDDTREGAGHGSARITGIYVQRGLARRGAALERMQERVLGAPPQAAWAGGDGI